MDYFVSYVSTCPTTGTDRQGDFIVQDGPRLSFMGVEDIRKILGNVERLHPRLIRIVNIIKLEDSKDSDAEDLADAIERALTALGESKRDDAVSILNSALASYALNP